MAKDREHDELVQAFAPAVMEALSDIPSPGVRKRKDPDAAARKIAANAALKAAVASGALAWPSSLVGWLSLLPQLRSVWRIQVQLVVDIAAVYGRREPPTQGELMRCMFQHAPSRTLRMAAGEDGGGGSLTSRLLHLVVQRVVLRFVRRLIGRRLATFIPVVGAAGVGAFAYVDTARVGTTAVEMFRPKPEPVATRGRRGR